MAGEIGRERAASESGSVGSAGKMHFLCQRKLSFYGSQQ